ncbi:MAG: CDP-diacylglycerol--glycerol-3-phosphate 3-phosphatidyltransferase [Clostridia bacterium]|nr:CDP-diacylglycerol--glycerol-3-phosphate 3-phosphatidyltransferase [Clostridia bacterium]
MTTANKITILRIILIPVFMAFMIIGGSFGVTAALITFILASVSDFLDGYIARNYNQISDFGKFMDPLADKMLTTAAYLVLLEQGRITWLGSVCIMLILTREFAVSGLRMLAAGNNNVIAASMFGKVKTVSQMVAIIAAQILMYENIFPQTTAIIITNLLVWISVIITVISGIDYLWKNKEVFTKTK